MKISENSVSVLKSNGFYFSNIVYDNPYQNSFEEANYNLTREISQSDQNKNDYKVTLKLTIKPYEKSDDAIISIELNGLFSIDCDDEILRETILNKNTAAILFPYLRSELTLITSQPGISPIVLPPININALFDSEN